LKSFAPARRTTYGTAILGRKWVAATRLSSHAHGATAHSIGVWSRPHPDEIDNGDAYLVRRRGRQMLCAVVDGLGHGRGAHEASCVALEVLNGWRGEALDQLFQAAHAALRSTRGAVLGAVVVDRSVEAF